MRLEKEFFDQIKNGIKTIEVRINDEKRRRIEVGDEIEFLKRPDFKEKQKTRVVNLIKKKTLLKVFEEIPANLLGEVDRENLYKLYTKEEEKKWGVVAIQIEKI